MAIVLAAVSAACSSYSPGPSEAAVAIEKILLRLPGRELNVAGLTLMDSGSNPGRRAGNTDAQQGQDVSTYRSYDYTGDPSAICRAILEQLMAVGWNDAYPDQHQSCDEVNDGVIGFGLALNCKAFSVASYLRLSADPSPKRDGVVSLVTSTLYPKEKAPPEGGALSEVCKT